MRLFIVALDQARCYNIIIRTINYHDRTGLDWTDAFILLYYRRLVVFDCLLRDFLLYVVVYLKLCARNIMGCFTALRSKKKKNEQNTHTNRVLPQELTPTTLPEPRFRSHALQSAPPSFRTRVKPAPRANTAMNSRMRVMSAPSSLHGVARDVLSSTECDEHEEPKSSVVLPKEQRSPSPQPLPLPAPQSSAALRTAGSFKSGSGSGPLYSSGPLPLPPSSSTGTVRCFSHEEIASACHYFSPEHRTSEGLSLTIYKASFWDVSFSSKKLEATVTRFSPSSQGLKEFVSEVNKLASLQHPNLCKLLGYHAREDSEQRILVYERLHHGSLAGLLYGRSDGPPIDWNARTKVALCAAQGLTFLHEEGPFQAMYSEFSAANIQIDKDFSAKLSGYGSVGLLPDADYTSSSPALGNMSVETLERGLLTPKSNVYSFGIFLLELLTGRKNMDSRRPKEERNLVQWSRPFLADECRLSLIMDPHLKGRFPSRAAGIVADVAQKCLQKDPSERPTMRGVVEHIRVVQDMKYAFRFPLQEPGAVTGKQMFRSPSLNGIILPAAPRQSYSHSSPLRPQSSLSPTRPLALPLSIPSRACSSLFSLEEFDRQESRKSSSSAVRRASVEGF